MIRLRFILLLVIFLIIATSISSSAKSGPSEHIDKGNGSSHVYIPLMTYSPRPTNCRYGVNLSWSRGGEWILALGVGHYINFAAKPKGDSVPMTTEFVPKIRLEQVKDDGEYLPKAIITPPLNMNEGGLGPLIIANPGQLWIVGNEPDVAHDTQDNMLPSTYAWVYHSVYNFIKELDPTAQVANAGLSMMTPGRRLQQFTGRWL